MEHMAGRDPTKLRNQKGNHYCMNCQQTVFAKTQFSKLVFAPTALFALWLTGAGLWEGRFGYAILGLIPSISYILYWYYVKNPVCPICKSRHFEGVTDEQNNSSQDRTADQQQKTDDTTD